MKVQGAIWPCNSRGYSHAELQVNASLTSMEALHLMSEKLEEVLNLLCDYNSLLVGGGWLRIWWFYRFQYQESRKDLSFLIYIVNHQSGSFPKGMLTRSALAAVLPTQHGHLSHLLPGAGFKMMRLHKGNSSRAFKKKKNRGNKNTLTLPQYSRCTSVKPPPFESSYRLSWVSGCSSSNGNNINNTSEGYCGE